MKNESRKKVKLTIIVNGKEQEIKNFIVAFLDNKNDACSMTSINTNGLGVIGILAHLEKQIDLVKEQFPKLKKIYDKYKSDMLEVLDVPDDPDVGVNV